MGKRRRKFGNVQPRGDRWRPRYRINGKWEFAKGTFATYEEAEKWLDEIEPLVTGNVSADLTPHSTMNDAFDCYEKLPRKKKRKTDAGHTNKREANTVSDYESVFRLHCRPFWGDMQLKDVDLQAVRDFQEWVEEKLEDNPRTLEKAETYTRRVLTMAVDYGAKPSNPYRHPSICMPDGNSRRVPVPLEPAGIDRLTIASHPHFVRVPEFTAYTGLRAGEVWALRKSSVNPMHKELNVTHSVKEVKGRGLVMGPPKNGRSRVIALPPRIFEIVEEQMEYTGGGPDDWLFPSVNGVQMRHTNFMSDYWHPAVTRAKLPERTIFHDLRHYCAHWHIGKGFDAYRIMELLGHSSITVTMDIYGGLFKQDKHEMAKRVGVLLDEQNAARVTQPSPIGTLAGTLPV